MASIKTFEDINAWQNARRLNTEIYRISNNTLFSRDFALKDQIRRSSISILSNIAEGFEREGIQEFVRFLSIAKSSCGELRAQLYVAKDLDYISAEEFRSLLSSALEVSKMIAGFISYLKSRKRQTNALLSEPGIEYEPPA